MTTSSTVEYRVIVLPVRHELQVREMTLVDQWPLAPSICKFPPGCPVTINRAAGERPVQCAGSLWDHEQSPPREARRLAGLRRGGGSGLGTRLLHRLRLGR